MPVNRYLVRRLGNKAALAKQIAAYFPKRINMWIEPFFGGGGMFFNKGFDAKFNVLNDIDTDVYNLWQVVTTPELYAEFKRVYALMPIHADLLRYWKANTETDPIRKALRFLFLSGLTFMGTGDALRFDNGNSKLHTISAIEDALNDMSNVQFNNTTADKFIAAVSYQVERHAFIYCDPPYVGTTNNYENKDWSVDDLQVVIDACRKTGAKFAVSEYLNNTINDIASANKLHINIINQRLGLGKKISTEILMTNYIPDAGRTLFDSL